MISKPETIINHIARIINFDREITINYMKQSLFLPPFELSAEEFLFLIISLNNEYTHLIQNMIKKQQIHTIEQIISIINNNYFDQ